MHDVFVLSQTEPSKPSYNNDLGHVTFSSLVCLIDVQVGQVSTPTANVTQALQKTTDAQKLDDVAAVLLEEARQAESSGQPMPLTIIFVERKARCDDVAELLRTEGLSALALHGGLSQWEREGALRDFTKGDVRVRSLHQQYPCCTNFTDARPEVDLNLALVSTHRKCPVSRQTCSVFALSYAWLLHNFYTNQYAGWWPVLLARDIEPCTERLGLLITPFFRRYLLPQMWPVEVWT